MPTIHLTNFISSPAERVFDLSRSIHLHQRSMDRYKETAVAGTTSGLIRLNETVTWKAKHLGKQRIMKVKITQMEPPLSFTDEMMQGDLKCMKHEHYFKQVENGTLMIDVFYFEPPYGWLGTLASRLFLTRYFRRLLELRNQTIKDYAESGKWQHVLK